MLDDVLEQAMVLVTYLLCAQTAPCDARYSNFPYSTWYRPVPMPVS